MKKQILFVDDDPNVLSGFQRAFRAQRNEWDMRFAGSGAEALEMMEQNRADLVVSDMRMSGMNGAELLAEIMKRYPEVVRIILSGHADEELIMKSLGVAHQFVSKPCEPEVLRSIIQRALEFRGLLCDEKLRNILSGIGTLPSLPAQYIKIANELQNPDTSIQKIGQIIAADPAMTAKVLQLVNSAFFGLRRNVTSAEEAVTYLGINRIQHLVLAVHAFSQFKPPHGSAFSIDALWEHSLSTAAQAKQIANEQGFAREVAEAAYTAGLLHDVGLLILASRLSERHALAVEMAVARRIPLHLAEEEVLSVTHAEVGAYLFGLWNLPESVVDATRYHHTPSRSQKDGFLTLAALHAADCQVVNRCYPDVPMPRPESEYLSKYLKNADEP